MLVLKKLELSYITHGKVSQQKSTLEICFLLLVKVENKYRSNSPPSGNCKAQAPVHQITCSGMFLGSRSDAASLVIPALWRLGWEGSWVGRT